MENIKGISLEKHYGYKKINEDHIIIFDIKESLLEYEKWKQDVIENRIKEKRENESEELNARIFKEFYELSIYLMELSKNFSRTYKFTLADEIKQYSMNMCCEIHRHYSKDVIDCNKILHYMDKILILIRMSTDLKEVSIKQNYHIIEKLELIYKLMEKSSQVYGFVE